MKVPPPPRTGFRVAHGLAALAAFLLVAPPLAGALTFEVDDTADAVDAAPGDGVCATAAGKCTLRAAVMEANARIGADRILLPAGNYELTLHGAGEDDAASGDLDLKGRLKIVGDGAGQTVIDGGDLDRVLHAVGKARSKVFKLMIRGGSAAEVGGGVAADETSKLILKRVVVEDNEAQITGGGVAARGKLKLVASTVRNNVAQAAGGVATAGNVLVRASTLNDNVASGLGGFAGHDLLATGPATVNVVNSTITGQIQTIAYCNGSICTEGADIVLANVTVNEVSRVSLGPDSGTFTLRNTIVEKCGADLISQGYNFIVPEGCVVVGDLTGLVVGDDPLLGSLDDHGGPTFTRVPHALSEAVDGGNPAPAGSGGTACEAVDQRGVPRTEGRCDIGAVEVS